MKDWPSIDDEPEGLGFYVEIALIGGLVAFGWLSILALAIRWIIDWF